MRGARLGAAVFATAIGLILAEGLCAWSRGAAYPFLNVFEASARYGVVLESRAQTRVRTRRGRVSSVRTNQLGFRGPELDRAPPGTLILGDSQVLGFGVEEDETVAGRLRARGHGAHAIAVPSWGPIEFALAAEEWIPRLSPHTVVFVANLANDWPEANVPNAERSTARDGWLSRRRRDAPEDLDFPGRRWLYGRSHLLFTLRLLSAWSARSLPREASLGAPAALLALENVDELAAPRVGDRSRLTRFVARVVQACASRCRVVVAVLPMDVQVDEVEWVKYRETARDLSRLAPLTDGLLEDLARLEVAAVDLMPSLRGISPGAFLDDDPHLSPKGHEAFASALVPFLGDTP